MTRVDSESDLQEFQLRAIEAVADLFEGRPRLETGMTLEVESGVSAVPTGSTWMRRRCTATLLPCSAGEAVKIDCGKAHFEGALGVSYARVTEASEIA